MRYPYQGASPTAPMDFSWLGDYLAVGLTPMKECAMTGAHVEAQGLAGSRRKPAVSQSRLSAGLYRLFTD
jgi:hypothetical protein